MFCSACSVEQGSHKKGPHKRTDKFLQYSNMPEIITEIIIRKRFCVARWRHKVSSQVVQTPHPFILFCVHIVIVMRVLNKMSMMTTLSLCVSCEFEFVYYGGAPTILNMALLRLNLALGGNCAHVPSSVTPLPFTTLLLLLTKRQCIQL